MIADKANAAVRALVLLMVVFWVGGEALADDKTYMAEYQLYSQALQDGDVATAEKHGLAAWSAAEDELGDHELTAVLAYNYGQLVLFTNTENAVKALRRANTLQNRGHGSLPAEELQLYLAYSQFSTSQGKRRDANELRKALNEIEAVQPEPNSDRVAMWLLLAWSDLHNDRFRHAQESADKAKNAIEAVMPNDTESMAQALLVGGVAQLVRLPRKVQDVVDAHEKFADIMDLYPPQKDVETFEKRFAQAIAWNAAADAAYLSLPEAEQRRVALHDTDGDGKDDDSHYFESAKGRPVDCGSEWLERDSPDYPRLSEIRGYIGAAIIVFDLDEGLTVKNPRILAEVPQATFGDISLKSMDSWRLKNPPVDHPGCRKNLLTQFTFIIEN